jgi:hypothetical protein
MVSNALLRSWVRYAIRLLISYKTLHQVRMSSVCLGKPTEHGDVRDAMGIGYQIVGCSPRRGCGKQDRTRESRPLACGIRWSNTVNYKLVQAYYTRAVSWIQYRLGGESEVVTADAGVNHGTMGYFCADLWHPLRWVFQLPTGQQLPYDTTAALLYPTQPSSRSSALPMLTRRQSATAPTSTCVSGSSHNCPSSSAFSHRLP